MGKCLLILTILFVNVFGLPKNLKNFEDFETTTTILNDSSSESDVSEETEVPKNKKPLESAIKTPENDVRIAPEKPKLVIFNLSTVEPTKPEIKPEISKKLVPKVAEEVEESTDEGSEEYETVAVAEDQNVHPKETTKSQTNQNQSEPEKPSIKNESVPIPQNPQSPQEIEEVPKKEENAKDNVYHMKVTEDAIKMPEPDWEGADDAGEGEENNEEEIEEVEDVSEEEFDSSEYTGVAEKHPKKAEHIDFDDEGISLTILEHSQIVLDILKSQNYLRQLINPGLEDSAKKYFNLNNLEKAVLSHIQHMREKDAEKLAVLLEDASQCDQDLAKEFTRGSQKETIARYLSAKPKHRKLINELIISQVRLQLKDKISKGDFEKDARSIEIFDSVKKPAHLESKKDTHELVLSIEDKLKAILEESFGELTKGKDPNIVEVEDPVEEEEQDCEGVDCIPIPEGRRMKEKEKASPKHGRFEKLIEKCMSQKEKTPDKSCGRLEAVIKKRPSGMRRGIKNLNFQYKDYDSGMGDYPKTLGDLMRMAGTTEVNFGIHRIANKGRENDHMAQRSGNLDRFFGDNQKPPTRRTIELTGNEEDSIILPRIHKDNNSPIVRSAPDGNKPIYPGFFPGSKFLNPNFNARRKLGIPEARSLGFGTNEARSSGTPEARSSGTPEARSSGTPEARSSGTPEARIGIHEVRSYGNSEAHHLGTPEVRSFATPIARSLGTAEALIIPARSLVAQKTKCQLTYSKNKKVPCSRRSSKLDLKNYEEVPLDKYLKMKATNKPNVLAAQAVLRQISSKFKKLFPKKVGEKPVHSSTENLGEILDDYYEDLFGTKITTEGVKKEEGDQEEDDIILFDKSKKRLPKMDAEDSEERSLFHYSKKKVPKMDADDSEERGFHSSSKRQPSKTHKKVDLINFWTSSKRPKVPGAYSDEKSSEEVISYQKKKIIHEVSDEEPDYIHLKKDFHKSKRIKPKKKYVEYPEDSEEYPEKGRPLDNSRVIFLDDEHIKKLALHTLNSNGNNFKKIIKNGEDCKDENNFGRTSGNRRRKKIHNDFGGK